jgi:hypothetical protein
MSNERNEECGKEWRAAWKFDNEIPEIHALFGEFFSGCAPGNLRGVPKKKLFRAASVRDNASAAVTVASRDGASAERCPDF